MAEAATLQLAREAFPDAEQSVEAEAATFLGGVAIRGEQGEFQAPDTGNQATLLHATQEAALGDETSRKLVRNNVAADLAERLYKVAHQTKVKLQVVDGVLQQNGRKLTDIHRNTLVHTILRPEMLRRSKQELKNVLLFQELYQLGVFEDHNVAVFSPTPTAMSTKEKKEYNFFLDTESCSVQLLIVNGDEVTMETAMVAGKATPESERHDIATIIKLMAKHGIEISTQDATDMLQYVVLIPKSATQNGVVDVVKMYDDEAGGLFYGQAKPRQDYLKYVEECERRNQAFDSIVDQITDQLIREAHMFNTPMDAIERLDYLSERLGVRHAAENKHINEAVFGSTAAFHIQEYRFFMEQGQTERADDSLYKAQQTANSGSCPIILSSSNGETPDSEGSGGSKDSESSGKKLMNCPFCKAKVFDDPCAKVLSCWDCKARVVNGHIDSKGDGGSKARQAARKQLQAEQLAAKEAEMSTQVDETFAELDIAAIEAEEKQRMPQQMGQLALSS